MRKNILITGGNGQLGSEIRQLSSRFSDFNFIFTDSKSLDITKHEKVERFIQEKEISIIINCAAYTAVDKAESEPEKADEVNHLAVKNLASISKKNNLRLIHISTDYVFDGNSKIPYKTTDKTAPINVYGKTKLLGEKAIQEINPPNSLIIRASWVYSVFGANFVKTMLRLSKEKDEISVVNDQVGSPTNAKDLASFILSNLLDYKTESVEIYHFSNEGICSWYEFAKEIIEISQNECVVKPISTADFPTVAKRPSYSVLDKTKTSQIFNMKPINWKKKLTVFIHNFSS